MKRFWLFSRRAKAAGEASHPDLSDKDLAIHRQVRPYTMTSELRIEALLQAVRYCVARGVPGAFVECGVWRGGSVLAMILQLIELGMRDRDIYLYDTFEGMTQPTEQDVSPFEEPALVSWRRFREEGKKPWSGFFSEEIFNEQSVRQLLIDTGYPEDRLKFVRGPVEQTIPQRAPDTIALLRLDTDWYESTRHELQHMYPRLCTGGVLIIDDYGHWGGCRRAVDEYFASESVPILLNRIDYTGRLAVKC